jgi:hypothetical protein
LVSILALIILSMLAWPAFGEERGEDDLGFVFTYNGRVVGWVQVYPLPVGPEMELQVRSNTAQERGSVWIQAEPLNGPPSGVLIQSSTEDLDGLVTLLADGEAKVYVSPQGVQLIGESELLFRDGDHRLFRCGDDLCWSDGQRTVVLSE